MATSDKDREQAAPGGWKRPTRTALLAMAGLVAVVCVLFSGYSSGFGKPQPHNISIAVVGTQAEQRSLDATPALKVRSAETTAAARELVVDRHVYGAFDFSKPGHVTLLLANGAGHSVEQALTTIGTQVATTQHETPIIEDLAPTSPNDPNGTVEFYAVVFLAIGGALGATVLARALGAVRHVRHLGFRLMTLATYSFFLAASISFLADVVFGALVGHFAMLLLALWAYTFAVCLAASGVSALFGPIAGVALTLTFTVVGNTSAGGAVGRPLVNGFFSAMTPIFPHGAGINIVRSVQYFGGRGVAESILCLSIWGGVGLVLLGIFAVRQGRGPAGRHEKACHDSDDPQLDLELDPARPATSSPTQPALA